MIRGSLFFSLFIVPRTRSAGSGQHQEFLKFECVFITVAFFFSLSYTGFFFFFVVMGLLGRCESCTVSVFMAAQVLAVSDCKKINSLFILIYFFFNAVV